MRYAVRLPVEAELKMDLFLVAVPEGTLPCLRAIPDVRQNDCMAA